ncbi:MAG TPA: S41 family peptidase [Segetibacter sp.]|jgi:Tol biopolymer transport system component/C-terminal processing protease CtpA/Prc
MKLKLLSLFVLFLSFKSIAQNTGAYFLSQPSLTPDGQTVVFSFEGDIWKANIKDGQALRLTAMQGYEGNAKVSPDGKWIAFTGRQFGNADVYLMPVNGGEIKQLTYFSGTDDVSSWSWDSRSIYFTSGRLSRLSSYKVNINGGTATPVFARNYFLDDHNVFENPSTGELFFNDTWESSNQLQRKGYKGPYNPDIQSYNPKTKAYKRYTNWQGKDFGATSDKNGNVYFISDEANGQYNLYSLQNEKKVGLTNFPTSIKNANVNAAGGKVVFEKDYQLWLYDVAGKKSEKLNISLFRNNVLLKEKDFDVKGKITAFDVSPDGKKLAFISRGELFVSDIEGKFIQPINNLNSERISEVKWLGDNRTLLFTQTDEGYRNLYTISADGKGSLKQLTNDKKNNRALVINNKRTKAAYLSGRDEVRLIDLKSFDKKTIAKDEIWGMQNSDPGFSPDDEYVVYTAYRNFEQDIFVHHIQQNKTINITKTGISEFDPIWSPDGRYIYFTSSRLKPSYPMGAQDPHMYRLPLQKFDSTYFTDKYSDLFRTDTGRKKERNNIVTTIDANRIMERIEPVGPSFSSQFIISVLQKDDKTTVLYITNQVEGKPALYKTELKPFEDVKTEKIVGGDGGSASVVAVGDKYYALMRGTIHKLTLSDNSNKLDPINIGYTFRRNLAGEFNQIFQEGWAQLQENYYDENFHGIDWNKTKAYYQKFLPYLNNRNDLRIVMNDMLGELNSSHTGFSSSGEDETIPLTNASMETGIMFDEENPYKVKYVVPGTASDKINVNVKTGDVLVKVNGVTTDASMDRYYYLTRPSLDKEVTLTFKRNDQLVDVRLHPQPTMTNELYNEWIDNNQQRVDEKSNKRIAYAVMKNMGTPELEKFIVDMTMELIDRDGLILDLRYNTGGNVHDAVLQFLSQRSYLKWKYREGGLTPQPNFAPSDKPIVLLINEQSLSDAEMTAQGFKELKLGKIIGNETYRWIIFTSGAGMVDGSAVRLPSWGCYTLDGKNLEQTGVAPDIKIINTFQDKIAGKDPQLDRAIEEVMKGMKK